MSQAPIQRIALWSLLGATLIAILVTAIMAPTWSGRARVEVPEILGQSPDFSLTNRDGSKVSNTDLLGSVWIADFIFTRCGLSCPRMTEQMDRLGGVIPADSSVYRVSFSVDPDHDTPEVLQHYAETWGIEDDRWLFLTGDRDEIQELVVSGFKLALDTAPPAEIVTPEEPILHSTRFVLLDAQGSIRGYYSVFEADEYQRLLKDLEALASS